MRVSAIKERIETQIAAYRCGGDQVLVEQLVELLAEWDTVSQPVRLLDESKGYEEPRSKEVYEILRDFCLCLANENGRYEEALALSRSMRETFWELPAAAAQLSQDVDILESLAEEARSIEVTRLFLGAVEFCKTEVSAFNDDVVASGFGVKSCGLAKTLYDAFANVAAITAGTEFAEMP